jgi:hypothetical protein
MFPVFSTKLELPSSSPSMRRFLKCLDHLCLYCIKDACDSVPEDALNKYWKKWMGDEWADNYLHFYTYEEIDAIESRHWPEEKVLEWDQRTYERLSPILGQHGWKRQEGKWVKTTSLSKAGVERK